MRRLAFGGSFNPIHYGHLLCAQAVAERAGFDQVVLIPSAHPPHKDLNGMADAHLRLEMCHLAVKNIPKFDVSDVELRRNPKSFTLETARQLRSEGWEEVSWLIGMDTVPTLPKWHQPSALLSEVNFVVVGRPSQNLIWDELDESVRHLRQNVVTVPLIDISATEIRRRVADGRNIRFHVPVTVAELIDREKLYVQPT